MKEHLIVVIPTDAPETNIILDTSIYFRIHYGSNSYKYKGSFNGRSYMIYSTLSIDEFYDKTIKDLHEVYSDKSDIHLVINTMSYVDKEKELLNVKIGVEIA